MASRHGKVAICISGLIRTGVKAFPCFQNFFGNLDADVFYHTWTDDPHKIEEIRNLYKPVSFLVSDPLKNAGSFGSQLYGIMMSNHLKKTYEVEKDFRYDLVIRTRFDLVFPITNRFSEVPIDKRTIYCPGGSNGYVYTDYESHGINDVLFWGDSESIDIVSDVYMYYRHKALIIAEWAKNNHKTDPMNYYYSVGNMIYDTGVKRNIHFVKYFQGMGEVPWREDVAHLDPIKDYDKIRERYQRI